MNSRFIPSEEIDAGAVVQWRFGAVGDAGLVPKLPHESSLDQRLHALRGFATRTRGVAVHALLPFVRGFGAALGQALGAAFGMGLFARFLQQGLDLGGVLLRLGRGRGGGSIHHVHVHIQALADAAVMLQLGHQAGVADRTEAPLHHGASVDFLAGDEARIHAVRHSCLRLRRLW